MNQSKFEHIQVKAEKIRQDFEHLTVKLMKKTMQHANKQLQDTLMNYFLENYVSTLLKETLQKPTNRAVKKQLQQNLPHKYPKYIALLNIYEDKIIQYGFQNKYNELLLNFIEDEDRFPQGSEEWKTHTRKRILSVLLYVHWVLLEQRESLQCFFQIWREIFPKNQLPFKKIGFEEIDQEYAMNLIQQQQQKEQILMNSKDNANYDNQSQIKKIQILNEQNLATEQNKELANNQIDQKFQKQNIEINKYVTSAKDVENINTQPKKRQGDIFEDFFQQQDSQYIIREELTEFGDIIYQPDNGVRAPFFFDFDADSHENNKLKSISFQNLPTTPLGNQEVIEDFASLIMN